MVSPAATDSNVKPAALEAPTESDGCWTARAGKPHHSRSDERAPQKTMRRLALQLGRDGVLPALRRPNGLSGRSAGSRPGSPLHTAGASRRTRLRWFRSIRSSLRIESRRYALIAALRVVEKWSKDTICVLPNRSNTNKSLSPLTSRFAPAAWQSSSRWSSLGSRHTLTRIAGSIITVRFQSNTARSAIWFGAHWNFWLRVSSTSSRMALLQKTQEPIRNQAGSECPLRGRQTVDRRHIRLHRARLGSSAVSVF